MIKGKDILNRSIIAVSTGEKVDRVHDVIFDHQANQVLGLLVDEGGWFSAAKVVPFERIRSVGEDAIMIGTPDDVTTTREDGRLKEALDSKASLIGLTLLTTDGQNLGRIADVFFDEHTGRVEGYEATGGLFADLSSGRTFVPAPESVQIGTDTAIVPVTVAQAMQEQEDGGLKGALSSAGESISGAYQNAAEGIKDAYGNAAEGVKGAYENIAEATRERQKEYVVGKTARSEITTDGGEVIVPAGATITSFQADRAEQTGRLAALTAAATGGAIQEGVEGLRQRQQLDPNSPEATVGRRVKTDVRAPGGSLVAAQGQIVTPAILDRAKHVGAQQALIDATTGGARPGVTATSAVSQGLGNVSESAGNLLERARNWLGDKREQAEQAIDQRQQEAQEQKVRDALGRPVTRVILAPDDSIILNVGEIVTHKAVQAARDGNVLDILVESVNKDAPDLDPLASRPDATGEAALDSQPDPVHPTQPTPGAADERRPATLPVAPDDRLS